MKSKNKKVTMSDIAEQLGISKNAVSLALNNKPGISDKLRQKIVETAQRMNYCGLALEAERSCIVVLVPEYIHQDTFFYSDVFWAIEQETKKSGHPCVTISISGTAEHELTLPFLPRELNILGLLVIGILNEQYLQTLCSLGFPMLTVDIMYHNNALPSVISSSLNGGYTATKYLIDCGHRKIGFVGNIYLAQSVYERWCGFNQAMLYHRIPVSEEYNILGDSDQFRLFNDPEDLRPFLDSLSSFPTAWFCAGDRTAIALLNLLTERRIRVPDDISIIGFDNLDFSRLTIPSLTTIHVDRKKMGELAVQHLIRIGAKNNDGSVFHISLPGSLVVRNSVKNLTGSEQQ